MKKYMLAALAAFTVTACTQTPKNVEENPMLGNWVCVTNYYDYYGTLGMKTNDLIEFDKEGVFATKGVMALPITEKPTFVYQQETFGKWTYKDKEITLDFANVTTKQAHSKETMNKLKKDKTLKEFDDMFMDAVDKQVKPQKFKILKQEKDVVILEQLFNNKSYFPVCIKAETVNKKVKNGEIKLNPNY